MRQWPCIGKPRRAIDASPRTRVDNHGLTLECAGPTSVERHFNCFRRDEAPAAHNQFGAACLVFLEMHCDQAINHLPLTIADPGHIDFASLCLDAKLAAAIQKV